MQDLEIRLYRLTTKSHLRVGAGEGSVDISAAENPIIRTLVYEAQEEGEKQPARVPYIPGSSLHGVVRSWVEKALRSSATPLSVEELRAALVRLDELEQEDREKKRRVDVLYRDALLQSAGPEVEALWGKYYAADEATEDEWLARWTVYRDVCDPMSEADRCERISGREVERRRWKERWLEAIGRGTRGCKVCRVFGYTGQRGKVKITPAFPLRTEMGIPIDIITRVAINRLTGAADEGKLFDLEAIPPGVDFFFFVVLENLSEEEKADFEMGIRALSLQLATVGAHSTIGFGMVEVERQFTAQIDRAVFRKPVEEQVRQILEGDEYALKVPLDEAKYPRFFLALASEDGNGGHPGFDGTVRYPE
jgi:CRISPR/Cas system CSM-associated protein Csm3 (group 7 of RAMP superfamily)